MKALDYTIVAFDVKGQYTAVGSQISTGTAEQAIAAWTKYHAVLCAPDDRDPATVHPLDWYVPFGTRAASLFAVAPRVAR